MFCKHLTAKCHCGFCIAILIIVFGYSFSNAGASSYYDPELGSLPQEQGWSVFDVNEPSEPNVVNGLLYQGPTSNIGIQGWYNDSRIFCFDNGDTFSVRFKLKVVQSDYIINVDNSWRTGFGFWAYDNSGRYAYVGLASDGVRVTSSSENSSSKSTVFYPFDTTDDFHIYTLRITYGYYKRITLSIDGISHVETALDYVGSVNQGDTNVVGFGDTSQNVQSEVQLEYCSYYIANSYGLLGDDWLTDIDDLQIFGEQWLRTDCSCPDFCEQADINQDGRVDIKDLSVICEMWLKSRSS